MNGRIKYVLLLLCILFVFIQVSGCASKGIQYQNTVQEKKLSLEESIQTKVIGKAEEWRNSGAYLEKGNIYLIYSEGRWHAGMGCGWTGGDGRGGNNLFCQDIGIPPAQIRGYDFSTLIGKVGRNGELFVIGGEKVLRPKRNGILYYRMNDGLGYYGDNSGSLDVTITLTDLRVNNTNKLPSVQEKVIVSENNLTNETNLNIVKRWAVIIGISGYKDTRITPLRYASADAKAFYNWAVSSNGGKYSPANVKILLDRNATTSNIKNALFVWLKQALEEDIVTIYFAGHGSPESPDLSNNLFLLTHDTQYDNISTTGFPMWDIETALKRYIKAKKVIVIADACHSGGVGEAFDIARRANRSVKVNPISSGIQNLSQTGDGVCVISASNDKQFSQESQKWGGGHGVFTYFLLKGLQGDADYNKNSLVTLGELTSYLSEQVRRETKNAQSPTVAGRYDPSLTIGH